MYCRSHVKYFLRSKIKQFLKSIWLFESSMSLGNLREGLLFVLLGNRNGHPRGMFLWWWPFVGPRRNRTISRVNFLICETRFRAKSRAAAFMSCINGQVRITTGIKTRRGDRWAFMGTPCFTALCFIVLNWHCGLLHIAGLWQVYWCHFPNICSLVSLCHLLVILTSLQPFSLSVYLLWRSVISDYRSLKARMMVSIFRKQNILN